MPRTAHVRHALTTAARTLRQGAEDQQEKTRAARVLVYERLASEDRQEMTQAANASPRNPANLERWRDKAREGNAGLDGEQLEREAERLRSAYYRELGKRSGAARRAANGTR